MPDNLISDMLSHKLWLGSVAPKNGWTDRIAFDIDAKNREAHGPAIARYWDLRRAMGEQRQPLVYGTPSGFGLRVLYRIPQTRLNDLIPGPNTGMIADALRSSGIFPENGVIEIYPRRTQADRLPLGRRMPLLDPMTLSPLTDAEVGDGFDMNMLLGALAELERWTASEDASLLSHIEAVAERAPPHQTTPKREKIDKPRESSGIPSPHQVGSDNGDGPTLFKNGLLAAGTRRKAEWIIGTAFMSSPEVYGLRKDLSRENLAEAIALWLSHRHNGKSADWNARLAGNGGDLEATKQTFIDEYLIRDKKGRTMPDRIALKVESNEPGSSFVLAVSPKEAESIFRLAERYYQPGIIRYRFECWLFAWLLAVKAIVLDDRKKGQDRTTQRSQDNGSVKRFSVVELRSRRMAAWPYGAGKTKSGQPTYVEFKKVLHDEQIMILHTPYRRLGYGGAKRDYASRFAVLPPHLDVVRDDVPFDVLSLRASVAELVVGREPLHVAVAMHSLYALHRHPKYSDRVTRYKRRGSELIAVISELVNETIAASRPNGVED